MRIEFPQVLTYSAAGMVNLVEVAGTTAEGGAIKLPAITLILFDGTRVIHMEAFDIDQRDQAIARFDELNG